MDEIEKNMTDAASVNRGGYAAAVSNAIGVHMDSFPLTPDKILAAIKKNSPKTRSQNESHVD